jgi:hypothetical protein
MLKAISADLKARGVSAEAIHIDAWNSATVDWYKRCDGA